MIRFVSLKSRGQSLAEKQANIPWSDKDYSYIDFYLKAYEKETQPARKMTFLHLLRDLEANRDFHTGSMRQINHLIQFDPKPNLELKEARQEIYKISVSFEPKCKFVDILQRQLCFY